MNRVKLILFLVNISQFWVTFVRAIHTGPKYKPTKGEVWPKPQNEVKINAYYVLENVNSYNVTTPFHNCAIVNKAVNRILYGTIKHKFRNLNEPQSIENSKRNDILFAGYISHVTEFRINLLKKCEIMPHLEMDESYELYVKDGVELYSSSVWGVLRGLQTFSQLLYFSDDFNEIRINSTVIQDYPAYSHRGLLIDTGRHFLPTDEISRIIDSMEMNKLNVLHWHIVDDQSFPFQSEIFPELSRYWVYTKHEIEKLIEQARLAGIRIIPEFDVPGHVQSWGKSHPNILTECYKNGTNVNLGPLNPIKKETYKFLERLYHEIGKVFPDEFLHIGGDEVNTQCWLSNPSIKSFNLTKIFQNLPSMPTASLPPKNCSLADWKKILHLYFITNVISLLPPRVQPIFWQDVFDKSTKLPQKTIIQVWRNGWTKEIKEILSNNYRVLFSSSWYLDKVIQKWETYYKADPRNMVYMNLLKQKDNSFNLQLLDSIIGGEACMWGEMADETNIFTKIWPNTAAVAERLWTGLDYSTNTSSIVTDDVRSRLEEHRCRMRQAGIPVAPAFGPSFCFIKS